YVYTVNTPGDSSATNLTNIVSTTVAQAYIRPQDGGLVKSVDLAYADVGQTITYTVVLKNTGNIVATGVTMFDTVPSATTFVAGSVTLNGAANPGNPTTGVTVGSLNPGSVATITFKAVVNTLPTVNPIPNSADVQYSFAVGAGSQTDRNTSNTVSTTVANADISQTGGGLKKSVDLGYADIGNILTYTIAVGNTGNVPATGVTFIDTIPSGTSYVAGSLMVNGVANPGTPGSTVTLGTINAGAITTVVFKVKVDTIPVPNPIPNTALVGYSYNVGTSTTNKTSLTNIVQTTVLTAIINNNSAGSLVKAVDLAYESVAGTLTYTITMKNNGNTAANNVLFYDTIPTDTTYVTGSATVNGSPATGDPTAGVQVGTIAPGATSTVVFKVTINTIPNPNPIPNQGNVNYSYTVDPINGTTASQNNYTNIVSTTVAQAHIMPGDGGFLKSVDKSNASIGDVVTYTLVLKNTGNVPALNVTVSDTIPTGTSYVTGSLTVNGTANPGNIQTGINIGTLNPNQVATVIFKVLVGTTITVNPIPNTANVAYGFNVGTTLKNEAYQSNTVQTQVNTATIDTNSNGFSKSVDLGFAKVTDVLTYTLTLTNTGNVAADNVTLIDTVPGSTAFVTGSVIVNGTPNGTASPSTGIPVGTIAPGTSSTVIFKVTVLTIPTSNPLLNKGYVGFNYTVDPTNPNGRFGSGQSNIVATTVAQAYIRPQDGGLVKSVDLAYADVGQTVTYTVVLKNTGNVSATNVLFYDTIPSYTSYIPGSLSVVGGGNTGTPDTGVQIGTLLSGGVATVTFKIVVNSIPTVNPIPNNADVMYSYAVGANTQTDRNTSNTVYTTVANANITNADGGLNKSVDLGYADVGNILTYTIAVGNTGNIPATGVTFIDTIPSGTTYVSNSLMVNGVPNAALPGSGVNLGTINAGAITTVVFKVRVNTIPNPNPIPNTALVKYAYTVNPTGAATNKSALTNIVQTTVLTAIINNNSTGSLIKSVDYSYQSVGTTLTYTITMKNNGNTAANNVLFYDTIPTDTTYVTGSASVNGSPATGDPTAGVQVGTIAPGATSTVVFKVTINTIPSPNPIPNQGNVNYNYTVDPINGTTASQNNYTNIVSTTVAQAHIMPGDGGFLKSVDKGNASIGDVVTYTLVLKNTGNVAATNVTVKDTIPTGTTYVNNSLTVNGTNNAGNIQTGINIGTLNPNQVATVIFKVLVGTTITVNPIPNTANVSYGFTAGTLPKNESYESNTVQTQVNIATIDNGSGGLTKSVTKDYAKIGDVLTYTFVLKNTGNVDANNIVLVDTVPYATSFVTGSVIVNGVSNGTATPASGIPVGTINPGAQKTVSFDVTVITLPTSNPILNIGYVGFNYTVDPTMPNARTNTGISNIVPTTINTAKIPGYPQRGIVKAVDKQYVDIGDTITYTISMVNVGNTPAINVKVQDTVPNDTAFIPGSATVNGTSVSDNPNTGIVIPNIAPNGRGTVTFQVTVLTLPTPNPIPNNATVNYDYIVNPITGETGSGSDTSNQVTTKVNSAIITAPAGGLIKNVDYQYANVGQTITYFIYLTNSGDVTALNTTWQDTIPNGTNFVIGSVYVNGANQAGANPQTGIFVGNLPPFSANTVTFQVLITTIPTPNPIPNSGMVGYSYIVDPTTNIPKNVSFPSNTVHTQVNNASITGNDGGLVKSVSKTYGAIGDTLTYTIVLKNTGNVNAINVLLTDTIPQSTSFIGSSVTVNGTAVPSANPQTGIPIGTVPPNLPTTVQFQVKIINTIPSPNPIPNQAATDYEYIVDQVTQIPIQGNGLSNTVNTNVKNAVINNNDGILTKMVSDKYVDLGQTITYTVVIGNTGNTVATNVFFIDTLPVQVAYLVNTLQQNGVTRPGVYPQTGFNLPNINPGDVITLTFNALVVSIPTINPITNVAGLVYSYVNDPSLPAIGVGVQTNEVQSILNRAIIDGAADGTLVKSNDKPYGALGDTITYTIAVNNKGNVSANNVMIFDTIPSYTNFVAGSVYINGINSSSSNPQAGLPIGTVASNAVATITFKVVVTSIPPSNAIPNQGFAGYTYTVNPSIPNGAIGGGATNTVLTTIATAVITGPPGTNGANSGGTKTATPNPASVGDTVVYSIAVYNGGNTPATNLMVYDTIPTGTSFVAGSAAVNGVPQPASNPQTGINVGTVNPGTTSTVTFSVLVTTLINPLTLVNSARTTYNFTTDPSVPNGGSGGGVTNPVTVPVNVATFGSLNGESGLVKSVDLTYAKIGDTLTYTIDVKNLGNVTANGVLFQDTIPQGTQFVIGSLTLNGTAQPGAAPDSGVSLGNVAAGQTDIVSFKVIVLTIPTPNPIPNQALVGYTFNVSPTDSRNGKDVSNYVKTTINIAIIGQPQGPGNPNGSGVSKSANPSYADIGTTVTYTMGVTNSGNVIAENVIINDIIPTGTTFVAGTVTVNGTAQPSANPASGITVGNINPGATSTVTFQVVVVSIPANKVVTNKPSGTFSYTVDPSVPGGQTSSFGGNTVTVPVNNANISTGGGGLNKTQTPQYATIGDTITYTINAMNTGSTNANNVVVTDPLNPALKFVTNSVSINNIPNASDNPNTGINLGTLAPNVMNTITFKAVVVTTPTINPIPNQANVNYTYNPAPGITTTVTNPSPITQTTVSYVNLGNAQKDSSPKYVKLGDTVTYTITIPNTGNVQVDNVVVQDTIPTGSTFVPNSAMVNGVPNPGNPQSGINIGSILAGGSGVLEFQVVVTSVPASGVLTNKANFTYSYTVDPDNPGGKTGTGGTNINTTTVTQATLVGPPGTSGANNAGTKSGTPSPADVGNTVTYTILLKNAGNVAANNVVINDTIPTCTTLVANSVTVNGATQTGADPATGINVGTINAGATATITYKVKVTCMNTPQPSNIVNQANVSYNFITDPSLPPTTVTGPTNPSTIPINTASFNLNGQNGIVKTVDKPYADRGDTLTYTIDLTNLGNTSANNVQFIDTIPQGTMFISDSLSVNGSIVNGANPGSGVNVGSIPAGATTEVIFKVLVLTIPSPNPIPNYGFVKYTYTVNPSIPNGASGNNLSNLALTTISAAVIGQPGAPGTSGGSGILKSASPTNADIGTTVTYTMVATNTGNTTANNVIISDTIANGSVFVPNSVYVNGVNQPGSNPESGIDVGNIAPAQTVTVTFQAVVVSIPLTKSLVDTPQVNYTYTVDPTKPDKAVTGTGNTVTVPVNNAKISPTDGGFNKSQNPEFATIGDTITYTINAMNTGSTNANNVVVTDQLDPALSFVAGTVIVNGTPKGTASPITGISLGTLAPNVMNTITFKAVVTTVPTNNPIKNQANVNYTYNPSPGVTTTVTNPSPITQTTVSYVDIGAGTKSASPKYVQIGDTITYTIDIPNNGNTDANQVTVIDTIPTGTTFVSNSVTVNGTGQPGANPQTGVNVGTIAPGSSTVMTFQVIVNTIPSTGKIANQASNSYKFTVDPANPDGEGGSKNTNITTTSVTQAILVGPPGTSGAGNTGSKTGTPSPADVGNTVTYTIAIKNNGNVAANNVVITDTIPTCTSFISNSVTVNGATQTGADPATGINVGTINAGATATITYKVKVTCMNTPQPSNITNQANISYNFITDPSLPPTTVTGPTNISTIPVNTASFNLNGQNGIVKTVDKAFADRGDTLTYTINLTNLGNTSANNIIFKDTIPNDTLYITDSLSVDGVVVNGANPQTGVSIGSIAAGGNKQISFKVLVLTIPTPNPIPNTGRVNYTYTVNPSIPNGVSGYNASNIELTTVVAAVIGQPGAPGTSGGSGILKSANPSYADIGTTVTYTMVIKNTGNTTAKNVIVYDTIALGSVFIPNSVYVDGANQPGANPETGIDVGNVDPGVTSTITFKTMVVSIPPSKTLTDTPRVDYSFTVDPTQPDKNVSGGGNTVSIPVNNATISPTDGGFNKSQKPEFATIGTTITYTINAMNTGSTTANNVVVKDQLDPALTFVAGTVNVNGTTQGASNPVSGINLGNLAPNVMYTITFKAVVTTVPTNNPIKNQANVNYTYSPAPGITTTVTNPSPITQTTVSYVDIGAGTKSASPKYVQIGDTVTYTIDIPNNGNTNANQVTVIDTIPTGTTFVSNSVTVNGTGQPGANPQTGVNVGTIAPGSSTVMTFQVVVNSIPASGTIKNQASNSYKFTVDPANPDGEGGSKNTNITTTSVTQAVIVGPPGTSGANNAGYKNGTPTNVAIGDIVTYTIAMNNSGNVPAINVIVRDTLPTCTTLVSGSVKINGVGASGSPFDASGLFVGTIPAGTQGNVTYKLKVTCLPTPPPATLKNQADITYSYITDPSLPPTTVTGPTNPSTIPVTVAGFVINGQNGIVKSVDKGYADRGYTLTYTINLTNLGNTSANNVVFKDTIPNDTSYIQNSLLVNGVLVNGANPQGGVSLGNIPAGGTSQVQFSVLVLTVPCPNPIPNTAVVNYNYTVDPSLPNGRNGGDQSNLVSTQVNVATIGQPGGPGTSGGSGVLKSGSPQNADIGTTVTYTLVLKNTGNTIAKNVVVSDTVPAGSVFIANSVYVNGVVSPGADPESGIDVGNIPPMTTATVTFQTMVVSIPPSKALVDTPRVDYAYTVDPSLPDTTVTGGGNTVTIPVNNANISTNGGGFNKSQNPEYATVGDTITYSILVQNTGSVDANNVKVYDPLNPALTFVTNSVKMNGTVLGGVSPVSGIPVGTVAPNAVYTITFMAVVSTVPTVNPIPNKATVGYNYSPSPGVTVPVTNPSNITTSTISYVDMGAMEKDGNPNYVKLGDTVTYTVTVPNNGNTPANNVVLKDTIPVGSTFVNNSVSINGVNTPGVNPQSGINIGTVNAGSNSVVQYQVVVVSVPASGKLLNQVTSSYTFTVDPANPDGRGGGATSNINQVSVTNASLVGPPGTPGANNTGSKVGTPTNVDINDIVSYTITMKNTGNVPAINVIVRDTLPTCTTLVAGSVTVNGVNNSGSPFSASGLLVGTIPAGSTAIIAYKLKVTCLPTPPPATLKNQADITYSFITDPSLPPTTVTGPTNPSTIPVTTAGFNVNGQNGAVKTANPVYADRGDTVTYTISLTNLGNTPANNVVFSDTLPKDTSYIQDSLTVNGAPVNGADPEGGVTIGTVNPNQTVVVQFAVLVLTVPSPNPLQNGAVINYNYTVDPSVPNGRNGGNQTNIATTTINNATIGQPAGPGTSGGSGVLKTASPANADIGTTVTYTLVLTNTGNATAKNVIVYDTIAQGSVFIPNSVYVNGVVSLGSNPEAGIDIGNINAGKTATVTFQTMVVSIPPSKALT
ncbi:MAG: hypothetical protein ACRC7N_17935, partial [Clostridium sp.]